MNMMQVYLSLSVLWLGISGYRFSVEDVGHISLHSSNGTGEKNGSSVVKPTGSSVVKSAVKKVRSAIKPVKGSKSGPTREIVGQADIFILSPTEAKQNYESCNCKISFETPEAATQGASVLDWATKFGETVVWTNYWDKKLDKPDLEWWNGKHGEYVKGKVVSCSTETKTEDDFLWSAECGHRIATTKEGLKLDGTDVLVPLNKLK